MLPTHLVIAIDPRCTATLIALRTALWRRHHTMSALMAFPSPQHTGSDDICWRLHLIAARCLHTTAAVVIVGARKDAFMTDKRSLRSMMAALCWVVHIR
jgi:hypothetical protein